MNRPRVMPKSAAGFDPFNDRLSRDLRNVMSVRLVDTLGGHNPASIEIAAAAFRHRSDLNADQAAYLETRLACYREVLKQVIPGNEPDRTALLFWNHELYFEFHELLERRWLAAEGTEKEILQGLIRAAGAFIHRQAHNESGARKMAARARETIARYRKQLPSGFTAEPLLAALADPSAPPPHFGTRETNALPCRHSGAKA